MGYYTKYDLDMEKRTAESLPNEEEVLKTLAQIIGIDFDEENPYWADFFKDRK